MAKQDSNDESLDAFCREYKLTLKRSLGDAWRVVNPPQQGAITGLPHSQGTLRATNGIDCVIILGNGQPFLGHLEWFERLVEEPATQSARQQKPFVPDYE